MHMYFHVHVHTLYMHPYTCRNPSLLSCSCVYPQITELLGEVRPSPCSELDQFLAGIRSTLMNLPSTPPVDVRAS